jgi:hypothetical protein
VGEHGTEKGTSVVSERQRRGQAMGKKEGGRCYLNAQQPMHRSLVTPQSISIHMGWMDGPQEKKTKYVTRGISK